MTQPIRVLMVEDSEDDALLMLRALEKGGYEPEYRRVETAKAMRDALAAEAWDLILCDYTMPRFDGLAALRLMKETGLDLPFIVVSGTIGEETAVVSMKAGAHDYIMKGNLLRLVPAVERELKEAESRAQRRQIEAAYQRSEQLLRDAQRIAKVGGWEYDTEAKRTTWTEEVYRIYGVGLDYDPNDISKNIEHYEDQATIEQAFLDAVQRGVSYDIELSFRSADGALKWVRTSGYPVREDGRITKVYGHIVDITEHKRILEETERARKDWEDIFQAISHPTIILDPEYGILSANKAAVHASGIAAADLAGEKCFEVFHGANNASPPAGCPMQKLLVSGHTETLETEMETPGGVYLVSCTPVFDRQGRLEKIIHIVTDITARREMEQAARESEQRYRSLVDRSFAGVYVVRDGRFVFMNENAAAFAGYRPEDLIGKPATSIVHPEDLQDTLQRSRRMLRGEEQAPHEFRIVTKDGRIRWIMETVAGIYYDGTRAILGNSMDITELKQAQQALNESRELEKSILMSVPHGLFGVERRRIFFANDAMEAVFGWKPQELIGRSTRIIFRNDREWEEYGAMLYTRLELEPALIFEWDKPFVRKDGREIFCRMSVTRIGETLSESRGIVATFEDITERRHMDQALRESRRQLSDIIEFLPDATLVIDQQGRVIAWNRAIEEMTGVRKEAMLGRGDYEYALPFYGERRPILIDQALHPDPEMEKKYTSIKRKGDLLYGEAFTPNLPAGRCHLSASASVLRNEKGVIVAAIECIRDHTAITQAQDALREAEERYRSIFENAQEAIYRSTPDGRIILANPAMAGMLGYETPEELMASVTDIARQHYVHPEEREKVMAILAAHGEVRNFESQHRRRDGSVFWSSVTMQAVRDQNGRILYYEGIDEDITDRKESIERLRKALGGTVQAISMAVETKDPYTAGHQRRTADLARAIATEMGLDADQRDFIRIAATIHDIGKIALPAEILSKPTKLTEIELSLIKTHALQGYEILKGIEFPWPVADVVLQHHERMDGSGYPDGLKGEDILPEARILSVADVVEAIASHRPYRPANGIDDALAEISKNRGILYDADVVDACLSLFREKMYRLS